MDADVYECRALPNGEKRKPDEKRLNDQFWREMNEPIDTGMVVNTTALAARNQITQRLSTSANEG